MPLSPAEDRELTHTRVVTCTGYRRKDGLWDIEGRIVDTKSYGFPNQDRGGWIEAGEALHDMSIRLTIDTQLEVRAVEAVIDASPFNYCKSVTGIAANLVGLKIAPGWNTKSRAAMGKHLGCTHLTELLGPVATTAIQTINAEKIKKQPEEITRKNKINEKPVFIDSCYAMAASSPVVRSHWPELYTSPERDDNSG